MPSVRRTLSAVELALGTGRLDDEGRELAARLSGPDVPGACEFRHLDVSSEQQPSPSGECEA